MTQETPDLVERQYKLSIKREEHYSGEHRVWVEEYTLPQWLVADIQRDALSSSPASGEELERAVMVCPQCEGEGYYADGLDEAACSMECTRCGTNGWIVDIASLSSPASGGEQPWREIADARLEQVKREWRWGNLTKLGVVNHLKRDGVFGTETAMRYAEEICALSSPSGERAQIVAWLRGDEHWGEVDPHYLADAIERGDHLASLTNPSTGENDE